MSIIHWFQLKNVCQITMVDYSLVSWTGNEAIVQGAFNWIGVLL